MLLKKIINKLVLEKEEKRDLNLKLSNQNLDRITITAWVAIPVSLLHILIFWLNIHDGNHNEYLWRIGIIMAHSLVILILAAVYVSIYFNRKAKKPNKLLSDFLVHAGYLFILIAGALIANIDQMVTNAISPYFVVCIFIPIIIIISPVYSLVYFIISYFTFLGLLPFFQHDTNILLSNISNGLTAAAFGFALSMNLWLMNVARLRQGNIIIQQKEKLEDQNASLVKLSEELKKKNKSKDSFFSILAHDLRSPVTGFIGLTKIIADEVESLSPKQIKEMAITMNMSANEIFRLLNNLLEWSKIQRGYITFNPEELNLASLIDSCLQLYKAPAKEKEINISTQVTKNITLSADRHMLEIILRNLISNALKFTHRGGNILVSAEACADGNVKLVVKENGQGMTPEIAESLFEISSSINRKGTSGEPSSGLGLVLCKEFITKHNGTIQVESEPGKGSSFTVTLPQNTSQQTQE